MITATTSSANSQRVVVRNALIDQLERMSYTLSFGERESVNISCRSPICDFFQELQ